VNLRARLPLLGVLVATVGLLGLIGPGPRSEPDLVTEAAAAGAMPSADEPGVLSSTWYCAAGSADGGSVDLTIVVANPLEDARRGTVTWFADGERTSEAIQVGAQDALVLTAADAVEGSQASAVVEIEGGGVAVEHRLGSGVGGTVSPCASAPSDTWFLANGSTARDARQRFYLFNPFPADAIVDIAFVGPEGRPVTPPALQGLAIPPLSTTIVDVGEHARRLDTTAAAVRARSGRLVVDRLQSFTGEAERTGASVALAAPAPAPVWHFAGGSTGEGLDHRWVVYNPGDAEAIVVLDVTPEEGTVPAPVERTVRAGSSVTIAAGDIPLLEPDVGFVSTVRTINDVPVVVERQIEAREPAARRGWTSTLGSPSIADRWLVPAGMGSDRVAQTIVVANPSPEPVVASVTVVGDGTLVDVADAQSVELGPAEATTVTIGEGRGGRHLSILVEADGPIVVERHLDWLGGAGIDASVGVPLR
jgi:hypothetical protein